MMKRGKKKRRCLLCTNDQCLYLSIIPGEAEGKEVEECEHEGPDQTEVDPSRDGRKDGRKGGQGGDGVGWKADVGR